MLKIKLNIQFDKLKNITEKNDSLTFIALK
jgi:hypothetical protein